LLTTFKGCGRGHDVALLAQHGFQTWGLEVSTGAVEAANKNVKARLDSTNGHHHHAQVVLGDFFTKSYETEFGQGFQGFDLVYDYTVRGSKNLATRDRG
jgi:hypothetical protein